MHSKIFCSGKFKLQTIMLHLLMFTIPIENNKVTNGNEGNMKGKLGIKMMLIVFLMVVLWCETLEASRATWKSIMLGDHGNKYYRDFHIIFLSFLFSNRRIYPLAFFVSFKYTLHILTEVMALEVIFQEFFLLWKSFVHTIF